jgi:hypothetical protein
MVDIANGHRPERRTGCVVDGRFLGLSSYPRIPRLIGARLVVIVIVDRSQALRSAHFARDGTVRVFAATGVDLAAVVVHTLIQVLAPFAHLGLRLGRKRGIFVAERPSIHLRRNTCNNE